ncbi:hypothetical protein [Halorubrum ezzemoulense]|uniref:hypothetical protein n=1 Tax=Halorubrum ezzemoulense TaxID=337243 RepID=UPI00111C8EBB|nr:hypothetical protein [Halorubrum ezzemoulense]
MSLDFPKWIAQYRQVNPKESIEYRDSSGAWKEDKYHRFYSISSEFQQRGYIYRDELRKIGKWKSGGRIDHLLKQNKPNHVERRTTVAFRANNDADKVEALTELKGVRVPVASAILTMYDPAKYAVIDYRAFRALGAAKPRLLDPQYYRDYAEFIEHFQDYNSSPEAYRFYMEEVRQIAQQKGILPREVDMALWAFDEHTS